jgi:hypothetical protein
MTFGGSVERGQPGRNEKTVRLVRFGLSCLAKRLGPDDRMFQTVRSRTVRLQLRSE